MIKDLKTLIEKLNESEYFNRLYKFKVHIKNWNKDKHRAQIIISDKIGGYISAIFEIGFACGIWFIYNLVNINFGIEYISYLNSTIKYFNE